MYYLLEDNRIVDSENIRELVPFEMDISIEKNKILLSFNNLIMNTIKIIKQSPIVYDLIDKENDLVKYNFNGDYVISRAVNASLSYIIGSYPESVIAIYKPDEFGNYIKVWEKKDE